ncbi:MAG: carbohydrate-binding domain-containing protein [Clostridia bacterium]|nr:carbohydrate-binding domain-containing protein [Clostridia bacterium]
MVRKIMVILLTLALTLGGVAGAESAFNLDALYKNRDVDDTYSAQSAVAITLAGDTATSEGSSRVHIEGNTVTITGKGDYLLTGELQGQVVIDADEEDKVRLILDGVQITSPEGPAIYAAMADKLILTLAPESENSLADTKALVLKEDTIAAALYAEDDLTINGTGKLRVEGRVKNGIQSKSDLILADGDLTIEAVNDGVKGRNSVLILDGTVSVTSGGDGIVSTREKKEGKGYIVIADGAIDVTSGGGESAKLDKDASSAKGIKAATDLTVLGGTVQVDAAEDAVHADGNITVLGGKLRLQSGDEGIQAKGLLRLSGGEIHVADKTDLKGGAYQLDEGAEIVYGE